MNLAFGPAWVSASSMERTARAKAELRFKHEHETNSFARFCVRNRAIYESLECPQSARPTGEAIRSGYKTNVHFGLRADLRRRSAGSVCSQSADVSPGPKRSFTRLARLHRSFPKPAIRGIVQKGLTRQGRQCGTFLPFVLDSPMSAFTVANVRGRTNCGQLATLTRSSPRKRPHRCSPSISG